MPRVILATFAYFTLLLAAIEQAPQEYIARCFKFLGSERDRIRIWFSTNLTFIPEQMEIELSRFETPLKWYGTVRQHFFLKLNLTEEACGAPIHIGSMSDWEESKQDINFTLCFGQQRQIVEKFVIRAYKPYTEGIYDVEGIHQKAKVQIQVQNRLSHSRFFSYDQPIYGRALQSPVRFQIYPLKLWSLGQREVLLTRFLYAEPPLMPKYLTVNITLNGGAGNLSENLPSYADIGQLSVTNPNISARKFQIFIQPDLPVETLEVRLVSADDAWSFKSTYGLKKCSGGCFLKDKSDFEITNLEILVIPLESAKYLRKSRDLKFYTSRMIRSRCFLAEGICTTYEHMHGQTKFYDSDLCYLPLDLQGKLLSQTHIPESVRELCKRDS